VSSFIKFFENSELDYIETDPIFTIFINLWKWEVQ